MEKRKLALIIACFLFQGCVPVEVETNQAVIQTRGVPIVQVVIQGPGGDLVPVEHELLTSTAYILETEMTLYLICLIALTAILIFRKGTLTWLKRSEKKEK
jgi:hypothetical protein